MSIVLTAFACSSTPGTPVALFTGASRLSPRVGSIAPTNTILPASLRSGTLPSRTSAIEMTRAGSERRAEKLSSMLCWSSVGTKRSPICTPSGRTITGTVDAAVLHDRGERERRDELAVRRLDHRGRLRWTPSVGSALTCTWPGAKSASSRPSAYPVNAVARGMSHPASRVACVPSTTLPFSSIAVGEQRIARPSARRSPRSGRSRRTRSTRAPAVGQGAGERRHRRARRSRAVVRRSSCRRCRRPRRPGHSARPGTTRRWPGAGSRRTCRRRARPRRLPSRRASGGRRRRAGGRVVVGTSSNLLIAWDRAAP